MCSLQRSGHPLPGRVCREGACRFALSQVRHSNVVPTFLSSLSVQLLSFVQFYCEEMDVSFLAHRPFERVRKLSGFNVNKEVEAHGGEGKRRQLIQVSVSI